MSLSLLLASNRPKKLISYWFGKKRKAWLRSFPDTLARIDFRILWYAVLLWVLAIFVGGFVILPWFYLIFTILVFWLTITFFRREHFFKKISRRRQGKILIRGLSISIFWSVTVLVLDLLAFVDFNFQNLVVYFSDARNWFKYPLIIMAPIIYSLVLENIERKILKSDDFGKSVDKLSRAGTIA